MPQLLLPGFLDGASQIGPMLGILKKDQVISYFVGYDRLYWHYEWDKCSQRFALAMLMSNGYVRPVDVERSYLDIPHRTLMNWIRQYEDRGPGSFFAPRNTRGGAVMTEEVKASCAMFLAQGKSVAEVARLTSVNSSTLRKAIQAGRVVPAAAIAADHSTEGERPLNKSERSAVDALAAQGMGTACTRTSDRVAAAMGLLGNAQALFQKCHDVLFGGLLAGLPALCANGLFSGMERYVSLASGFYSAKQILSLMGFMALARIRRPENLRHLPPGELGRTLGLDRSPEVRTLRIKIATMAEQGDPEAWMQDLSRQWMANDPQEAGYLYSDGHIRVYHGSKASLPRRYVSREKLCLRGTSDYWVNDALGRPFFVVSQPLNEGLAATLIEHIVPELLVGVPNQPSEAELAADPLLHRFVIIFDREGSTHSLLSKLWEHRIAAITYRKAVKDKWLEKEFAEEEVPVPGGGVTKMRLAKRQTALTAGKSSIPVLEVRRLTQTGHQTAIITTAQRLEAPAVAGRMFSRWCQENFFAYMMQHYDIDGLVQYGSEDIPGTKQVVNPAWRRLDKTIKEKQKQIKKLTHNLGDEEYEFEGLHIEKKADLREGIQNLEADIAELSQQRRTTPKKITLAELPEAERPRQLRPLAKTFTDTIKMIAYRAETALVGLLQPHLAKEEEARALLRELFVSSADIEPNERENTLTVRIHHMASPAHNKAIRALLDELNKTQFHHPEAGLRMVYDLV